MTDVRSHIIVKGKVQGVWFRDSTRREAVRLGLYGWVKNCYDRSVEIVVEGPSGQIGKLLEWCQNGPSGARVSEVNEIEEEHTGEFNSFRIDF